MNKRKREMRIIPCFNSMHLRNMLRNNENQKTETNWSMYSFKGKCILLNLLITLRPYCCFSFLVYIV